MKRLAAIIVVAPLVGCGPSFPTIDGQALAEAVSQVRDQTVKICNYFPSDSTLVSILTASHPVLESAYSIAKQICEAVTAEVPPVTPAQMQAPRAGDENQCLAMVRGVCVEGRFLQPTTKDQAPSDGTLNKDPQIHPAPETAP